MFYNHLPCLVNIDMENLHAFACMHACKQKNCLQFFSGQRLCSGACSVCTCLVVEGKCCTLTYSC